MGAAILSDCDGGMAGAGFQVKHIGQGGLGRQVRIGGDKALFVSFDAADHIGLLLHGLGAIDEGNATLFGQCDGQLFTRNALHNGRNHRDVHAQGTFFFAFAIFDQRGTQADRVGHTGGGGVPRHQQILTKGAGRLRKIVRHRHSPFVGPAVPADCFPQIVAHPRTKYKFFSEKSSPPRRTVCVKFAGRGTILV